MSGLPAWLHALIAMGIVLAGLAVWKFCWWLSGHPAVAHFVHAADPLCWRCFESRRMREEKKRHRELLSRLHG